jgi:hypothetical protein
VVRAYDVLGDRVQQTVDPDGTGLHNVVTTYAYDVNGNAIADLNSGGTVRVKRVFGQAMDALIAKFTSRGGRAEGTFTVVSGRARLFATFKIVDSRSPA